MDDTKLNIKTSIGEGEYKESILPTWVVGANIENEEDILKLSKVMKVIMLIEFILVFINLFVISRLFVLLLIFPFIGYYGVREYHKRYILAYVIFVSGDIILDLVLSIKYNPYFVAYFIYDLINIAVSVTYFRYIQELTQTEINFLKTRTQDG